MVNNSHIHNWSKTRFDLLQLLAMFGYEDKEKLGRT